MSTCSSRGERCIEWINDECIECGNPYREPDARAKRAREIQERIEARAAMPWNDVRIGDTVRDAHDSTMLVVDAIEGDVVAGHRPSKPHHTERWHRSLWWNSSIRLVGRAQVKTAFTPTEVEACIAHGSAMYERAAQDCDQVKLLEALEEQKAEEERFRLSQGPAMGYRTVGDWDGELGEDDKQREQEYTRERAAWLATLTPPLPGESPGDWAARHGVRVPVNRDALSCWRLRVFLVMERVRMGLPVE